MITLDHGRKNPKARLELVLKGDRWRVPLRELRCCNEHGTEPDASSVHLRGATFGEVDLWRRAITAQRLGPPIDVANVRKHQDGFTKRLASAAVK
jgi:hypothetical protein